MSESSEIEELINRFAESVNLSENEIMATSNANTSAPPQPTINYTLLKMYTDTITPYNGDQNTLNGFQSACDFLFTTYNSTNDPILSNYLLRIVRMKLINHAQILVGCRMELDTWDKIKNALTDCFGDKRSLECLEQDLFMAMPNRNENSLDFAKRLQVLRSTLAQKINSFPNTHMDGATKLIHLRQYDQVCLRAFIRGLPAQLQSIIRLKAPDCIETAMSLIIEEDNFQYMQNLYKNPGQSKPISKNQIQTRYPTQNFNQNNQNRYQTPNYNQNYLTNNNNYQQQANYTPNYDSQFRQPQITNQNNNPQTSQFPKGPINIQSRYVPQKNFPTNRQVFGPPKNVFKPTGQVPTNKPEPMSTRSRYTMPKQSFQSNQYFKPSGPKNFISQELFQIEENASQLNEAIDDNVYSTDPEEYQAYNHQNNDPNEYNYTPEEYYTNSYENNQDFNEDSQISQINENFQLANISNHGN